MFKKLIKKKKTQKQKIIIEQTKKEIDIIISRKNSILKIEINDYISISDYIKKMKSNDEYNILNLICNSILWNSNKQKVNKGTYYVITINNYIYNILFTDEKIKIDERTKIKLDEQTKKENIIQERLLTFNINKNEYHYFSAKHDETGNTFYTRYYNKNKTFSLGTLDLTDEETYNEVNSLIYNLENINEIKTIIDIELLKEHILKDLSKTFSKTKENFMIFKK